MICTGRLITGIIVFHPPSVETMDGVSIQKTDVTAHPLSASRGGTTDWPRSRREYGYVPYGREKITVPWVTPHWEREGEPLNSSTCSGGFTRESLGEHD